jgi:Zn-dependent protease
MIRSSYQIGHILGIPIRIHFTLIAFLPLMAWYISSQIHLHYLFGLLSVVLLIASVAMHELGHALVAKREGCGVQKILLLPIGGIAMLTHMPEQPAAEIRIAVAGPVVSLLLMLFSYAVAVLLGRVAPGPLALVFTVLAGVNFMLVAFNLLPSFPMDGGRVFRALMTPRLGRLKATRIASTIGRGMAVLFGIIGLFGFNLMLVAIAIFLYHIAGAEYRMVRWQHLAERFKDHPAFRTPPLPMSDDEVVVGPPPYARNRDPQAARPLRRRGIFDDLFGEGW